MFFSKKRSRINLMIDDYLSEVTRCIGAFDKCMSLYFVSGIGQEFSEQLQAVNRSEGACDDKRRQLEFTMYNESLIPESRGDLLGLLEAIDRIPNKLETILLDIYSQNLKVPDDFKNEFQKLFEVNVKAARATLDLTEKFFENPSEVKEIIARIDQLESSSDGMEVELVRKIFLSETDDFKKILLKDLVKLVGGLADRAENYADRINILSVKTVF